jgi:histone-lysine N-methyltransferase SUV39H
MLKFVKSCLELQNAWNNSIRTTGAAAIFIINDIDSEEVPPLVPNFEYCENTYI